MKQIIFVLALLCIAPAADAQKKKTSPTKVPAAKVDSSKSVAAVYVCPMHPDVKSDKPGECPKCGMALVKARVPKMTHQKLDRAKLIEEGKYQCCIRPACDACANMGHACDCYSDVKKGDRVCNECYQGWQEGKGAVPGIEKDSVKTYPPKKMN
jgi:hypothetical protein